MVPKTQHLVSLLSEEITFRFVLFFFHFASVLPAVKLDYQSMFETAEIGDKTAKENAPLPFAPAVAVVRVCVVWIDYPRKSALTGSTHFVLLATSLQDTPRAGLRTQRALIARG
jgi:hypothetical protein